MLDETERTGGNCGAAEAGIAVWVWLTQSYGGAYTATAAPDLPLYARKHEKLGGWNWSAPEVAFPEVT